MTLADCEERVTYWRAAAANAQWEWLKYEGSPWEKERLRRAYNFADRLLLGWERQRDAVRARLSGPPQLRIVRSG